MANMIGTVTLASIQEYSFDGGRTTLSGHESSQANLESVRALFAKSEGNTSVERILGGLYKGIDLTADYENWKKCAFDATELYDGWYLLLGFRYNPVSGKINYYPYSIEMFWFKSTDVTGEAVGTGNGSTKTFTLDHKPVVPTSETIKLDGTPTEAYIIDYDEAKITFDTAPGAGVAITADYAYFS